VAGDQGPEPWGVAAPIPTLQRAAREGLALVGAEDLPERLQEHEVVGGWPLGCTKLAVHLTVRWNSHLVFSNSGGSPSALLLVDEPPPPPSEWRCRNQRSRLGSGPF